MIALSTKTTCNFEAAPQTQIFRKTFSKIEKLDAHSLGSLTLADIIEALR